MPFKQEFQLKSKLRHLAYLPGLVAAGRATFEVPAGTLGTPAEEGKTAAG